jgi:UDP-2,4-diacetamido-2,4,6-trideoxy-beta-L-altropyranose hydrolase
MRCLTLAKTLKSRGLACEFLVGDAGRTILEVHGSRQFYIHSSSTGATEQLLLGKGFDTLILDDYAVSSDEEAGLRPYVNALVVIDDLANRPHLADLLIDPGYGRRDADYDGLVPDDARRLVGPKHALVGQAFVEARAAALGRHFARTPKRLFMSFGLSDVGGIAARAYTFVRARLSNLEIEIALSSGACSTETLKAAALSDGRLHLHFDASNVAELMARADMTVGAGGASTWERCCLGLPTLAVIVADNQRAMIERLAADGVVLSVDMQDPDFENRFGEALDRLVQRDVRVALGASSAAVCDGKGAARIADAMLCL